VRAMILLLAGCTSWKFDDSAPIATVHGDPPSLDGRQRVIFDPHEDPQFVAGADGVQWVGQVSLTSDFGPPPMPPQLVRLGDPPTTLMLDESARPSLTRNAVFETRYDVDMSSMQITGSHIDILRPGGSTSTVDLSGYIGPFTPSDDLSVIYVEPPIELNKESGIARVVRTDGSFQRSFNVYMRPTAFFDLDADLLFTFDADDVVRARSALDENDSDIGQWKAGPYSSQFVAAPEVILRRGKREMIVCDGLGVRTMQFMRVAPQVWDTDECLLGRLLIRRGHLIYFAMHAGAMVARSVPLDGGTPIDLAHSDNAIAYDPDRIAWTTRDPRGGPFSPSDVGDGWIDQTRFMERGHFADFSSDGKRLYFLEHAATGDGVGELTSYEIATGATHVLALNTREWQELDDGRLIAVTNSWTEKVWNRVVVIDEARRTVDWVADGADGFTLIPGTHEVLVQLVAESDETKITMARMPIPERAP
jgi:hypothetical protein